MQEINEETRKALQNVARHEMLQRLLADITFDLQVCNLEGWDRKEYISMLKNEIDNIYSKIEEKEKK